MDTVFPKRKNFQRLVREFRTAKGWTREQFADALGVEESHLHGLLYDKRVRMTLDLAQRSAEIMGCSILEIVDDPGSAPAGSNIETTAVDRFILETMGSDLSKMTDAQKRNALAAWKGMADGILGR